MSKNTHPADGLYALSLNLLNANGACHMGRQAARVAAGIGTINAESNARMVPVTLKLLTAVSKRYYGALSWLIYVMRSNDKVTYDEFRVAEEAYYGAPPHVETNDQFHERRARIVMDLLLARHNRETINA